MELVFERGESTRPKGHAILYFRNSTDNEEIWATYLMALPISVDVSKYVPPFLANQITDLGSAELSAFAFPPAPEKLGSHEWLQRLAELREDDIIYGGVANVEDVTSLLYSVNETVQSYSKAYSGIANQDAAEAKAVNQLGVREVLYPLMSESDRLGELTKLVGKLRFAIDGGDQQLAQEAEQELEVLSRYLPENHHVGQIIAAAKTPGEQATKLADLYIQRCYLLIREEYEALQKVEERINAWDSSNQQ